MDLTPHELMPAIITQVTFESLEEYRAVYGHFPLPRRNEQPPIVMEFPHTASVSSEDLVYAGMSLLVDAHRQTNQQKQELMRGLGAKIIKHIQTVLPELAPKDFRRPRNRRPKQ